MNRKSNTAAGFSLLEALVALAVLALILTALAAFLIESSKASKSLRMRTQLQSNARSVLSLVVQRLRSAGWDPLDAGIPSVALDADPTDPIEYIDAFGDFNANGDVLDAGEVLTIRHVDDRVEWRESGGSFEIVAVGITNDADGDGVRELMFTPDATPNPGRITVTVTAASSADDPTTGFPARVTLSSDVVLRNED